MPAEAMPVARASLKGIMNERERRIFEIVKEKVVEVLIDVNPDEVTPEKSLVELGANSIDRVEVSMNAMEALDLQLPLTSLAGVSNLYELTQFLCRHATQR